jgi:hypothetical protein
LDVSAENTKYKLGVFLKPITESRTKSKPYITTDSTPKREANSFPYGPKTPECNLAFLRRLGVRYLGGKYVSHRACNLMCLVAFVKYKSEIYLNFSYDDGVRFSQYIKVSGSKNE